MRNQQLVWSGLMESLADINVNNNIVKTAQRVTGTPLPSIEEVQKKRCLRRARSILKDSSHPAHRLFSLLPSGRRFRSLRSRTSRLSNSFFHRAVTLLNSTPLWSSLHHSIRTVDTGQALSLIIDYNLCILYLLWYFLLHFWLDAKLHFIALYLYMSGFFLGQNGSSVLPKHLFLGLCLSIHSRTSRLTVAYWSNKKTHLSTRLLLIKTERGFGCSLLET